VSNVKGVFKTIDRLSLPLCRTQVQIERTGRVLSDREWRVLVRDLGRFYLGSMVILVLLAFFLGYVIGKL
jgi:hypothetical protein